MFSINNSLFFVVSHAVSVQWKRADTREKIATEIDQQRKFMRKMTFSWRRTSRRCEARALIQNSGSPESKGTQITKRIRENIIIDVTVWHDMKSNPFKKTGKSQTAMNTALIAPFGAQMAAVRHAYQPKKSHSDKVKKSTKKVTHISWIRWECRGLAVRLWPRPRSALWPRPQLSLVVVGGPTHLGKRNRRDCWEPCENGHHLAHVHKSTKKSVSCVATRSTRRTRGRRRRPRVARGHRAPPLAAGATTLLGRGGL